MANKKSHQAVEARKLYDEGMKLVDIAEKLGVPDGTVRRWKSTQKWDGDKSERSGSKSERSLSKQRVAPVQQEDGSKETFQNDDLTPEQQYFCIFYVRTFNATQSYLKAYGCKYETAMVEGCKTLRNPKVKEEIERLREIKRQQIVAGEEDIVELQMRIAFSDMGDFVEYGGAKVALRPSDMVDTQLIKRVKESQHGISIEVEDRQKAIDWLTKYFLMHPDDKYKAEFDRKRAEVKDTTGEVILKNMETIADILRQPARNRNIEDFEEVTENE